MHLRVPLNIKTSKLIQPAVFTTQQSPFLCNMIFALELPELRQQFGRDQAVLSQSSLEAVRGMTKRGQGINDHRSL